MRLNFKKINSILFLTSYLGISSTFFLLKAEPYTPKNLNTSIIQDKGSINKKEKIDFSSSGKSYKNENSAFKKDRYLTGPGDLLELTLLDAPEFSGEYTVLNDGTIQLPLIGSIYINNLSIDQASNLIEDKYREQLLRPELHLIVKISRPIKISLIGEIERPGIYSLSLNDKNINGLPTIVDAIQKAGGITQNSNLKKVILLRRLPGWTNEYKQTEIDLINLIFEGNHNQNLFLFDGDIIKLSKAEKLSSESLKIAQANLSPRTINVRVVGQVSSPGDIELKANTPLIQAVLSAGGPLAWKANKGDINLVRVNPNGTVIKKRYKIDLKANTSFENNPPLKDRDIVYVKSSKLNTISTGLSAITAPISSVVTSLSLFKLLD